MEAHLTLTVTACGVASMGTKLGVAPRVNTKSGKVNLVQESAQTVENFAVYPFSLSGLRQGDGSGSYVVFNEGMKAEKIYATNEEKQFKAIVDSGASEIVEVDTLQELKCQDF